MKKTLKRVFFILMLTALTVAVAIGAFSASAKSSDPADNYTVQKAPAEDSSISLWFEHSFNKVLTKDTTPSGMNTYSVYMAKNEIENAQFILCSDSDKEKLSATVTSFTDQNGNEIPAEIYYQLYVTTSSLNTTSVWNSTEETTIIREGETPDPMIPLAKLGTFKLNAGKSQAFYIRIKSSENTPSGWYSAQLDVKNEGGEIIKTATVFCYVWDFVISEETEFKTAIYFDTKTMYGSTYQKNFDYLLENRIVGMDIPGGVKSGNPYLTNPRVNAVRVGVSGGYMDNEHQYFSYADVYSDLKNSKEWDEFKDKLYFYTVDEPMGQEQQDAVKAAGGKNSGHTVTDVIKRDQLLDKYWGEPAATCVPYHHDHPYPYYYYDKPLSNYADFEKTDSTQTMIDTDSCRIWCPLLTAFTPNEELAKINYGAANCNTAPIRSITKQISGMYAVKNPASSLGYDYYGGYYNWDAIYGEFNDRVMSDITIKNEKNNTDMYEMWTYLAGGNNQYTYCHHLIESTGLQTKMLFWQCYQQDITGYLYYYANEWSSAETDTTVTGAITGAKWNPGITTYNNTYNIYGAGVLFYGPRHLPTVRGLNYVGTVRIELMRDGIEEYQMFKMLEDLAGEDKSKAVVNKVSKNVVRYLSLPGFDRSAWSSSMDEYDIMASVRLELGNTLEAYSIKGTCDHSFDEGVVILEPTCLEMGTLRKTCTKCGIKSDDIIPTLHSVGDCYKKIGGNAATCTTDGNEIYECTICRNRKTVTTTAFHNDKDYYRYEPHDVNTKAHTIYCTVCSQKIDVLEHIYFNENTATCTEGGEMLQVCRYCDYSKSTGTVTGAQGHNTVETTVNATCTLDGYTGTVCKNCDFAETTVIKATGHSYENGSCTVCGEAEPLPEYVPGDANGDGSVKGADSLIAKRIAAGIDTPDARQEKALDVNGDGKINFTDTNLISRYIAGIIFEFPISK